MATRIIKYGNDFLKILEKPDSGISLGVTYWDLWISLLLEKHFDGNWDELINYLYDNHSYSYRNKCESMVAHIHHLRDELSNIDIKPPEILTDLDADFLKKQETKAKKKIIEFGFNEKEKSKWMHQTPRKIYYAEALQGSWDTFPITPHKQVEALRKKFKKKSLYTKQQTFALEEKLSVYIEKNEKKPTLPKLLALYRAFLTVILENIKNIDDSYGETGGLAADIFRKYLKLDWRQLSIDAKDYFTDIIRYVIWEDYGMTDKSCPLMFKNLVESEIEIIELILQSERKKLISHNLTYEAENALSMLGYLYAENCLFYKFIPTAKEMGTREWERITVLSKAAEAKQEYEIALNVFEVALKESGRHTEYLRKEYTKLKTRVAKKTNKTNRAV